MLLITRQKQFPPQPIADGRGDGWCCSPGHRQPLGTPALPSLPRKSKEEVAQPQRLQLDGERSSNHRNRPVSEGEASQHHILTC